MWCVLDPLLKNNSPPQIHAVEYYGLTPGAERDIFQRVQLGMALTAAGKP